MKYLRAILVLFVTGAILGSVCDGFHTHSLTTFYPRPWILKMAWWVPLLFGSAGLAIGLTHPVCDRWFKRQQKLPLSWYVIISGLGLFMGLYFLSGFLNFSNSYKFFLLGILSVLFWGFFDRTWQGLALGILTALVGCTVEIMLSALGLFDYTHPDLWGIPAWLPWLYIAGSTTVGNLGRKLVGGKL